MQQSKLHRKFFFNPNISENNDTSQVFMYRTYGHADKLLIRYVVPDESMKNMLSQKSRAQSTNS